MSNEAIKFTFVVETTANDAYVITITSEYGQTWKVGHLSPEEAISLNFS